MGIMNVINNGNNMSVCTDQMSFEIILRHTLIWSLFLFVSISWTQTQALAKVFIPNISDTEDSITVQGCALKNSYFLNNTFM